ncbi:DUF317 domain-containing protein [Streptomyces sp. NPDC013978]|uniref:DUF317 domain-containing protein n=1 Tax=Streptomyces sp. NPDC013978 TaxID=3364869 RepID=UPI0036FC9AD8
MHPGRLAIGLRALQHARLDRERTWSDDTTHAIHESQTLRIERVHKPHPHETAWTVAAYETPVSDRMWHLTATGTTPAPVLQALLHHLAEGDGWDTVIGSPVDEKTVTAAAKALTDAGWKHSVDGRWIRWTNPSADAGIQFDAFAAQQPNSTLATWTIWAGRSIDHSTWRVTASPYTPAPHPPRTAPDPYRSHPRFPREARDEPFPPRHRLRSAESAPGRGHLLAS